MTGTLSTPRWTSPTSAGNVSILARSPVAPKITSASTRLVVISAPCLIAPSPLRARPRRGAPPDTGDPASGQAGDALPDEQDAEDEEEHQHDRGVVARQPGPPALQDARRLRAHREVDNERRRHRDAGQHYEDRQDGRLLAARQPGLRDRDGRGDGQDKVLGIEAGQRRAEAERLAGAEAVKRRHPLWCRGLLTRAGTAAPLPRRQEQEADTKHQLDRVRRRRRAAAARHPRRVRDDEDDPANDDESEHPASHEGDPAAARPGGDENQDDRDDRQHADGHAERQRQDATYGLAHTDCPLSGLVSLSRRRAAGGGW